MTQFRGRLPFDRTSEKLKDAFLNFKSKGLYTKLKIRSKDGVRDSKEWLYTYRIHLASAVGVVALIAGLGVAGNAYVKANMNDVYEVYLDDTLIGEVSSPDVIEQALEAELKEKETLYPEVQWELERDGIRIEKQTMFKAEAEDPETVSALRSAVEAKSVGVEVIVNGEAIAIVKDKATANRVLERVKAAFASTSAPEGLTVLSAEPIEERDDDVIAQGKPQLLSTRIIEPIDMLKREVQPNDVMDEQAVVDMLIQGDTKPTQYIVQEGDTPWDIADKLDVPVELIYTKNQDNEDLIERDLIRPGDVLDLTMQKPGVTIESVEKVTETIAVQYETIYEEDGTMRKGETTTVREGRKGSKKVTYQLTKVNGLLMEEKVTDEAILEEPVPAIVRRGTKVILGEGTGRFSWPVVSASVSSGFGSRWGRQHKGLDLTSSNKSILAADNGTVVYAGYKSDYGYHIIIDHKNGYKTLYAHMSKLNVEEGDIVEKGDKIGVMGNSGQSTGVHLHFEVIVNGVVKSPLSYLRKN